MQGMASIRTTAKDKKVFVHVFDWPTSTCELPGFEGRALSARLLANGRPLTFRQADGKLQIDVPAQAPDPNVGVIAIKTY